MENNNGGRSRAQNELVKDDLSHPITSDDPVRFDTVASKNSGSIQSVRKSVSSRVYWCRSDVQRAVSGTDVSHGDEQDVDQGPDAQASETEELPQSFSPLPQVEAVGPEPAQGDAGGGRSRDETSNTTKDQK